MILTSRPGLWGVSFEAGVKSITSLDFSFLFEGTGRKPKIILLVFVVRVWYISVTVKLYTVTVPGGALEKVLPGIISIEYLLFSLRWSASTDIAPTI